MLKVEDWLLIRDLYSQGLSISKISERTGRDRKTVRKYAHQATVPERKIISAKPSKLDPFKPYIIEKLNEAPYTAARLFREIKEQGYDGGEIDITHTMLKRTILIKQTCNIFS